MAVKEEGTQKSYVRMDVLDKVAGRARYVDDLCFDGMLHLQTVHSPFPSARILGICKEKAMQAPGVVGVYTAADVPGINAKPKDKPVLVQDRVRCYGDGVALVAAETRAQAHNAASLVEVAYEEMPIVTTVLEALAPNAPLIHGDTNEAMRHEVRKGDLEAGFAAADLVLERTYTTQRAAHGAIEPDGAVAVPENGGLTLYCPGKAPFNIKRSVAAACGLPENRVRVIQPVTGGAFGGKDVDIHIIASRAGVAALKTGRSCKLVWSREEVMAEGSKRHPFTMKYVAGVTRDGRITALQVEALADVGAYLSKSRATIWRAAVEAAGPYRIDNIAITVRGVFTNNPYSDAVRGLGSPQVDFAMESFMDELARAVNRSPYEIRRLNALVDGQQNATGQQLDKVNLLKCLDILEPEFPLDKKVHKEDFSVEARQNVSGMPSARYKRGRGIASVYRGEARGAASGEPDEATVVMQLEKDGGVRVLSGIAEMGQGGANMVLQVVGDELGIPLEKLYMNPLDTHYVPDSGPTTGSRGTITSGNAALMAARDLRAQMQQLMADHWRLSPDEIRFREGRVWGGKMNIPFEEAAAYCLRENLNLTGYGNWALPKTWWNFERHKGDAYASYNYGACGVEVEVDSFTGKVRVCKVISVHDVGALINPKEVEAQVCGAISMALGYALYEEIQGDNAVVATDNFDSYLLCTVKDMPVIRVITLDDATPGNPLGVKGIGEPAVIMLAPAVANAIKDAIGVRLRGLPIHLETVVDKQMRNDEG